ncbi:hypothetical protein BO78DRAFT_151648 [Aspergillus sclerotiicarbonarius CBS 121057]|uniref:Uncharacterized protein n=1 Tax=Aspergillus sclerotiicarbonarius (strain CBS 121057 / IBT 28362) TaxID=1448318 RepID=A0A319FF90_ASPSB|nr:hypothetical protein BO78DRAFT_151648 [Aspergillus sclerotiicarbonarius CBS 121057]
MLLFLPTFLKGSDRYSNRKRHACESWRLHRQQSLQTTSSWLPQSNRAETLGSRTTPRPQAERSRISPDQHHTSDTMVGDAYVVATLSLSTLLILSYSLMNPADLRNTADTRLYKKPHMEGDA